MLVVGVDDIVVDVISVNTFHGTVKGPRALKLLVRQHLSATYRFYVHTLGCIVM